MVDFSLSVRVPVIRSLLRRESIVPVLVMGLLLRLVLATFPAFEVDLGTFTAWSRDLGHNGPWNFYHSDSFADWTPGYLYVLTLFGVLDRVFTFDANQYEYLLKLPSIAFDLASVYLLYRLLEGQKPELRFGAAAAYSLSPALLVVGPVWAQVDSALAFFLLLTVYYFAKGRPVAAATAYTVGFLTKPQAIAALPFLAFWVLRDQLLETVRHLPDLRDPTERYLRIAGDMAVRVARLAWAPLAVAFLIIFPFFPDNPWGIFDQLQGATEVYPYSTFFAYNFWGMLWAQSDGYPGFPSDSLTFLGLEYRSWGIFLFVVATMAIIFVFRRARSPGLLSLAVALSVLAFFVFLTRMHERYLLPFFLPFLAACVLTQSRALWVAFGVLSIVHFLNVYNVYSDPFYNKHGPSIQFLYDWSSDQNWRFLLSALTFLSFPALLAAAVPLCARELEEPEPT